jgi:hypothetical protein
MRARIELDREYVHALRDDRTVTAEAAPLAELDATISAVTIKPSSTASSRSGRTS